MPNRGPGAAFSLFSRDLVLAAETPLPRSYEVRRSAHTPAIHTSTNIHTSHDHPLVVRVQVSLAPEIAIAFLRAAFPFPFYFLVFYHSQSVWPQLPYCNPVLIKLAT